MLVSVYIPSRNRMAMLKRAVESVLNQTYSAIEVIVVNDASTDGTQEYLESVAARDPRVTVHSNKEAKGAPTSRNLAIKHSRGDFVTGLDDDDAFEPHRIAAFVEYWDLLTRAGGKPSCLYAQETSIFENTAQNASKKPSSMTADDLFEGNSIGGQVFAPRSHYLETGLFDETLPAWQDLDFLMRLLRKFGPARLLDLPTYLFDNTDRPDRISLQSTRQARTKRIRSAYAKVSAKYPDLAPRQRQMLMLQVFSRYYDIRPTPLDFVTFSTLGFWPQGYFRILKAALRANSRTI